MSRRTEIYSIFGQIETVIATTMMAEGKVNCIKRDMIPATARFDEQGREATMAIVASTDYLLEFNRRVKALYA